MVHPVFEKRKYIIYYIFIWWLIASINAIVLSHYYGCNYFISITDSFIFYILFGILGIGLWYTVRYNTIDNNRFFDILLNHLGVAAVSLLLWFFSGYYLLHQIFESQKEYIVFLNQSIPWRLASGIFFYCLTILFYYLIISYQNLREKTKNETELKALVKETELSMLKSQINPHFLFNSLNSISSLTITNPAKAQEMIIKLSEFLRRSIGHKEVQMVTLDEEIEHIMLYLDIEKVRFGDRLRYDFHINNICGGFLVPSMLLQPLFENAVKHGVYESMEEVIIMFSCEPVPEGIKIKIANNFDPDAPPRKGNHMGIKNIGNRLKLIYQYDDLLKINKTERNFEVEILLPKTQASKLK
jgi:sensor histidine kinase YesM